MAVAAASVPLLPRQRLLSFDGGWNLIASPSELGLNESPSCLNVTLDERGGVLKRLGLAKVGDNGSVVTTPLILYYSRVIGRLLLQCGTGLYASSDGGATWSAALKTFSTASRVGICDFQGKAVIIHPVDGVFTYDGTTFSAAIANGPKGNTLAVWENAIFSAGDPLQPTRVTRSDLGAITWPAAPTTNDLRVKDDTPLTCLMPGPATLLAFKEESVYRVSDPTTIAYSLLGATHGASGPLCVALNGGQAAAICKRGITVLDGVSAPRLVSSKLTPLFNAAQLNLATAPNWTASIKEDRYVFSFALAGVTLNNITLEYSPLVGWIVPHNFGMQDFANYVAGTRKLLGVKIAATSSAAAFEVFKGGTDDGKPISASFQTAWFAPAGDTLLRLRRALVRGRGNFQFETRVDYEGSGKVRDFLSASAVGVWGVSRWGAGAWGTDLAEIYRRFFSLGVGRAFSYVFSQTSSGSRFDAPVIAGATLQEVGDFACYGVDLDFVPLGGA
jgi:hypothetical protein